MKFNAGPPSDDSDGGTGAQHSRRAAISLTLGTAAFLALFVFPFGGIVLGIPAATNGVLARREIDASQGTMGGRPLADYGLAAGVVSAVFAIVILSWDIFTA